MALFGNSSTAHRLPEYRVAALASLDLEEHMKDNPLVLDRPGHIEWMVTEDEDGYLTAHGAIRVPVNIVFAPATEEGADPESNASSSMASASSIVASRKKSYTTRTTVSTSRRRRAKASCATARTSRPSQEERR